MQHQSIFSYKHFCNRFSPFSQSVPKPIALEPCFGNKAAVLSIFVRLPRSPGGIPPPGQSGGLASRCNLPPHWVLNIFTLSAAEAIIMTVRNTSLSSLFSGLAVGSALVDVSQQMCLGYKEKSGGLRSRKQQPLAQPATCIWHLPLVLWPRSHRDTRLWLGHIHRRSKGAWLIKAKWTLIGETGPLLEHYMKWTPMWPWLIGLILGHLMIFNLFQLFYSIFTVRRRNPCTAASLLKATHKHFPSREALWLHG